MRTELQEDIDLARNQLHISVADFKPLPYTTDWRKLEERIYQSFCRIAGGSRPIWLWEHFKYECQSIDLGTNPYFVLSQLVPREETILFMASDGGRKFLFYEGKATAIENIVGKTTGILDEYYLISKKYEWLLCVNHHDYLIGTGNFIIQQMRAFIQQNPQLVIQAYPA